jgi:hypothetical protein
MPTHQQLRAAISARAGRFAFSQQWMASEIDSFVVAETVPTANIVAVHYDLAEIVSQSGNAERETIARAQVKRSTYLIGNHRDAARMRIRITLKFVGRPAQVTEDFDRVKLVAFDGFDWHKI